MSFGAIGVENHGKNKDNESCHWFHKKRKKEKR